MVSKGTSDLLVNVGIVALVIVIIYFVIIRNPKALDWLKGIGSKTGAAVVGAVAGQSTFGVCPGPSDRAQWCTKHECLSSGEEAGGYITITNIDKDTEEVSIKFRGGTHKDECVNAGCCYILGVKYNGNVNAQTECPHPDGMSSLSGHEQAGLIPAATVTGGTGSLLNRTIGIMGRVYPEGSADKLETWLDVDNTGTFEKFYETTSDKFFGKCNGISGGGNEELTFIRIDDVGGYDGASLERAWSVPYTGGGGGAPTGTPSGVTDVDASTDCSADGGGEEEEEPTDEEPEDDEEEEGDDEEEEEEDEEEDGGEQTCADNRCTCASGAFFTLVAGQTCADCTRMCANANQAKVVAREARKTMRDVMYQSFNGRRHRYNRYLPRQNGYGFAFASKRNLRLGNLR